MRGQGKNSEESTVHDEPDQRPQESLHVGKWGKKKSTSREKKSSSPRFGEEKEEPVVKNEEGKGFDTLIQDSENMFLEAKNPLQFENYVDELEGILQDVHKRIQMLPEIPIADEVIFRDDDELQFSLTAEPAALKKGGDEGAEEMDMEEVDLDYFSNYSKLETLRMQLEEAFGLDNFIRLYRYIEKQVSEKGLEGFDIVDAIK